jgi:hypothetical protein
MKIAAILININDVPCNIYSVKANENYYSHFNIELRQIKTIPEFMINEKPKWTASRVFDIFPDLDFCIVQDLDLIPCNLKYNILDFLLVNELNLAIDSTRIGGKISNSPFPFFKYNAGLIAYNKKYAEMFRSIFEYGKNDPDNFGTCDQYYINQYIGKNEIFVNEIPQIFNTFFYPNLDFNKISFCHYTNFMQNDKKNEYIEKYHPKELLK